MARAPVRKRLLGIITDNFGLKVFAVLVAIGLYGLVRGAEDETTNVPVRVRVVSPPPGSNKILVSELPDEVQLTIHGSVSQINKIVREGLDPVQIDLREARGSYYTFDPNEFELPAGVDVEGIAPRSVPLTWATRGTRTLPVRADITGEPLLGTRVREVRVAPDRVQVSGPEIEIDGLTEIRTEPIDITGLRVGHHERQVPLLRSRRNLTFGTPAPMNVTIDIGPALDELTLDDLEIAVVGTPARAQLRPSEVDVLLRGLPATMQGLDADRVVPFVDLSQLEPTGVATPVRVDLRGVPEGLDVVRVEPPEVLVTLTPRR